MEKQQYHKLIPVFDTCERRVPNLFVRNEIYYLQATINGKRYLRSCPKDTLTGARQWVKKFISAAKEGRSEALEKSKARSSSPKLGAICKRYLETVELRGRPRLFTAKTNVTKLKRIVALGTGNKPQAVDNLPASVLNRKVLVGFTQAMLEGVTDQAALDARRRTIRSTLRQGRSLFARKIIGAYKDMKMPDVSEFMAEYVCEEPKKRYTAPKREEIEPIIKAGLELWEKEEIEETKKRQNKALYRVFLLAYALGLRASEMIAAKWNWIRLHDNGRHYIDIIRRPEEGFIPKGREGSIPIGDDVMRHLEEFRADGNPHILGGTSKEYRKELVYRTFATWMRGLGWTRGHCAHELRAYRGHLWRKEYGLDTAHDWLRHVSWQTTLDSYADITNEQAPMPL